MVEVPSVIEARTPTKVVPSQRRRVSAQLQAQGFQAPPALQADCGQSGWKPEPVSTSIQAMPCQGPPGPGRSVAAPVLKKSTNGVRTDILKGS